MLKYYLKPILAACTFFPAIAAVFTLPFVIHNYRKYGGIAIMRVIVVYSFILYCMCTFLLTVMPLPSMEAVAAMEPHPIGWIPYKDMAEGMAKAGLRLSDLSTFRDPEIWRLFLDEGDLFQMLANIAMTVPLGFYLRYYFRLSFKKTVIISFCASLFFEITQLTGLYFIYPKAYRFTQMDDLIDNTLGGMLGYALTPAISLLLPSREEIDRISYLKGEHITPVHNFFAAFLDVSLCAVLLGAVGFALQKYGVSVILPVSLGIAILFYYVFPCAAAGSTPGQLILKVRTVRENGKTLASNGQLIFRNFLLYGIELFFLLLCASVLAGIAVLLLATELRVGVRVLFLLISAAVSVFFMVFCVRTARKQEVLPHSYLSRTTEIPRSAPVRKAPRKRRKKA